MGKGLCRPPITPLLLAAPFISATQIPFTSSSKALCPQTLHPSSNPIVLLSLLTLRPWGSALSTLSPLCEWLL